MKKKCFLTSSIRSAVKKEEGGSSWGGEGISVAKRGAEEGGGGFPSALLVEKRKNEFLPKDRGGRLRMPGGGGETGHYCLNLFAERGGKRELLYLSE